jgi:hypothetical protein
VSGLRYVYGIVPESAATVVDHAGLRGIDDSPVRTIRAATLAAAYSEVDEDEYGEARLNEHVRDLEWLTPRAESHQTVNARLLDLAGTVLPLAFGTLYLDDERVRAMIEEDGSARVERLGALAGRGEWVVTVVRDADISERGDGELVALERQIAASPPGRGYLLGKRRAEVARDAAKRSDAEAAEATLARLTTVGERTFREPVVQAGPDVVVVRVSLLAARSDASRVASAIAALGDELGTGYRVRATGPWPAYRFGAL